MALLNFVFGLSLGAIIIGVVWAIFRWLGVGPGAVILSGIFVAVVMLVMYGVSKIGEEE